MAEVVNDGWQSQRTLSLLKKRELGGQLANGHCINGMGFTGKNQSPQLYWENPPEQTKAFAVTLYDL